MLSTQATHHRRIKTIYGENVAPQPAKGIYQYQWIKSIDSKNRPISGNDAIDYFRKDISKTKSFQIKHGAEDLEQRNRQMRSVLFQSQLKHKELTAQYQLEEASLLDLTHAFEESKAAIKARIKEARSQRRKSTPARREPSYSQATPKNLDKNLELQIHFTDGEIKKLETKITALKSSETYYDHIPLTSINGVYLEEISRLGMLKAKLDEIQVASRDQKYAENQQQMKIIREKITKLNNKIQSVENEILKAEKFIRDHAIKKKELAQEKSLVTAQNSLMANEVEALDCQIAKYRSLLSKVKNH
jgi:hypothetical protein